MKTRFDVLVLGAGYTGPLAALVLARQGYSVAIVDRGPLPHFAIGESVRSEQNAVHDYLGSRYGLPELRALSSYVAVKRSRAPIAVWPKECTYFLLDPDGADRGAAVHRELMHQSAPWPAGPDYLAHRGDFDLHLLELARRRGATVFLGEVGEIDLSGPVRCAIATEAGPVELAATLLVDASGRQGVLAERLRLADADPKEMTLRSRAVFSHFVGVRRLEDSYARGWPRLGIPRDHSVVHHLWPGGWAWVIPFESGATSVGLTLNMDADPLDHDALTPTEAFTRVVAEVAPLAETMADAAAIRPMVRTGRLQWRASRTVGDAWAMLPPACGFTDPLLSPGMLRSALATARLVEGADAVLRRGAPARAVLGGMEATFFRESEYISRIQHCLYLSFSDFAAFREAHTLERLGSLLGGRTVPGPGAQGPPAAAMGVDFAWFRDLIDRAHDALLGAAREGAVGPELGRELREILVDGDRSGYVAGALNRPRREDIHLLEVRRVMRWSRDLRRSRDSALAGPPSGGLRRLVGVRLRMLLRDFLAAYGPGPRGASLLALVARQIVEQLGLRRRG